MDFKTEKNKSENSLRQAGAEQYQAQDSTSKSSFKILVNPADP